MITLNLKDGEQMLKTGPRPRVGKMKNFPNKVSDEIYDPKQIILPDELTGDPNEYDPSDDDKEIPSKNKKYPPIYGEKLKNRLEKFCITAKDFTEPPEVMVKRGEDWFVHCKWARGKSCADFRQACENVKVRLLKDKQPLGYFGLFDLSDEMMKKYKVEDVIRHPKQVGDTPIHYFLNDEEMIQELNDLLKMSYEDKGFIDYEYLTKKGIEKGNFVKDIYETFQEIMDMTTIYVRERAFIIKIDKIKKNKELGYYGIVAPGARHFKEYGISVTDCDLYLNGRRMKFDDEWKIVEKC